MKNTFKHKKYERKEIISRESLKLTKDEKRGRVSLCKSYTNICNFATKGSKVEKAHYILHYSIRIRICTLHGATLQPWAHTHPESTACISDLN